MKKNIFFNLFFIAPIALIPMFTTSCSATTSTVLRSFNHTKYDSSKTYSTYSKSTSSLKDLIFGQQSINDGNYVLIFGCTNNADGSFNPAVSNFFNGDGSLTTFLSKDAQNVNNDKVFGDEGILYNKENSKPLSDKDKADQHIQLFTYIENDNNHFVKDHKWDEKGVPLSSDTPCSPFTTWSDRDASTDKGYTDKDQWWKDHKPGSFCRNDADAKEFRYWANSLKTIFGDDKFNSDKTFGCLAWNKGKLLSGTFTDGTADKFRTFIDAYKLYE